MCVENSARPAKVEVLASHERRLAGTSPRPGEVGVRRFVQASELAWVFFALAAERGLAPAEHVPEELFQSRLRCWLRSADGQLC